MGAQIDLPEGDLKLLSQRIEEIILGIKSLFSCTEAIESLAQSYASQVIRHLSEPQPESLEHTEPEPNFNGSLYENSLEVRLKGGGCRAEDQRTLKCG